MLRPLLVPPPLHLAAVAASCLALAACGKPPTGSATLRGCNLEVYVYTSPDASVEALGEKAEHLSDDQFRIVLPLDRLPAGAKAVEVVARRGSSEQRATFAVEAPHDGTPAGALKEGQCVALWQTNIENRSANHPFKLVSGAGSFDLDLDREPQMEISVAPAGRVTVLGKPIELKDGGARFKPDVDDIAASLHSAALNPGAKDPVEMFIAVTVERPDGQARAERLAVQGPLGWAEKHARARLARVAQAPFVRPRNGGAASVVVVPAADSEPLRAVGAPGPLSDAAFIALQKTTSRPSGTCTYDLVTTVKAFEIDSTLEVYDARTGARAGERLFKAKRGQCPSVLGAVNNKVPDVRFAVPTAEMDGWLASFTKS